MGKEKCLKEREIKNYTKDAIFKEISVKSLIIQD